MIANRLSDPRIRPFTSVTRVVMSPDLRIANVYVSVMGSESDAKTTMQGLDSARGAIQTRVARRLDMRQCPELRIALDKEFRVAMDTIRRIDEIRDDAAAGPPDASPMETDDTENTDDGGASADPGVRR